MSIRKSFSQAYYYHVPPLNYPIRKSEKGDFVFIHINKTGGTSVAKAIGLPKKRHLTVSQIINLVGEKYFDKAFKFCVVRNPWSKVVSHYKYRVKTNQCDMETRPIAFTDWVKKTYGTDKDPFYFNTPVMFMEQSEWLKDKSGNVRVDQVIKFEALEDGFNEIIKRFDLKTSLPKLNSTKHDDYRDFYNEETKEIVANAFKNDIQLFGYTFNK